MEIKDSLLPTSVTYSGEFLSSDAKIPTLFEINEISSENVADEGMMFRDDDSPVEKHIAEVSKKVGGKVKMVGSVDEIDNARVRADIESGYRDWRPRHVWRTTRRAASCFFVSFCFLVLNM